LMIADFGLSKMMVCIQLSRSLTLRIEWGETLHAHDDMWNTWIYGSRSY
jgi:hypothetical protein